MAFTKIESGAIAQNAVSSDSIAPGAVTVADVEDGSLTAAKLDASVQSTLADVANKANSTAVYTKAETDVKIVELSPPTDLSSYSTTTEMNTALSAKADISSNGSLVVPTLSSDPSNPSPGDSYFDNTTKKLNIFDGSDWGSVTFGDAYLSLPYTTDLVSHYDSSYMISTSQTDSSKYTSQTNSPGTWYDRSGNGNHLTLTNGTGTRWDPDVQNGRGAVWFDTSQTYYSRDITKNTNAVTSFIVYADHSPGSSSVAAWSMGPSPYFFNWYNNSDNTGRRWETGTGPQADGTSISGSNTQFWIASGRQQNTAGGFNWRWSAGYSFSQTGQDTGTGTKPFNIGTYAGYYSGYICEVIAYDSYLSDADYDAVYNFLREKWGV